MFKLFAKKKKPEVTEEKEVSPKDFGNSTLSLENDFEINAELGGVKGWPSNVSVVEYNSEQGLLFAGTDSGSIFVYGKDFQYFRPHPTAKSSAVLFIVPIGSEMCLVVYKNNNIAVLRTPSLFTMDFTKSNWMTNSDESGGEITCVHVDEYTEGEKTFVYVGTSEGFLHVIEVSPFGMIRICDYSISTADVELPSDMGVTAVLSDEKCLMIAYSETCKGRNSIGRSQSQSSSPGKYMDEVKHGIEIDLKKMSKKGAVIVYNMTKKRIRHAYLTVSEVTSMVWDSTKDSLYAVLKSGEILSLDTRSSRSVSRIIWNANSSITKEKKEDLKKLDTRRESSNSDDDNIEDEYESDTEIKMRDDNLLVITQIKWLAPQTTTNTNNSEGCFFLLLSSKMKSTVVGLTPAGPHGEMMEVITFSQLPEGISDLFLVPTFSSEDCTKEVDDLNPGDHTSIPALLLVSQPSVSNDIDGHESNDFNNDGRSQSPNRFSRECAFMYDVGNKSRDDDASSEVNIDTVQISKGKLLSLVPCPIGVTTIPTTASGATPITIAVAIAVAITDSTSPKGSEIEGFGKSIMRNFLPSGTMTKVTSINALLPCTILTSLAAVLSLPKDHDAASKKHKNTRRSSQVGDEEPLENSEAVRGLFEVVLSTRDEGSSSSGSKSISGRSAASSCPSQDLVFLGQSDGSIGIWSVSPSSHSSYKSPDIASQTQSSIGKDEKTYHAVWSLLRTIPCTIERTASSSQLDDNLDLTKKIGISLIHTEENYGLFTFGTFGGLVVVWEVFELSTSIGFIEHTAKQNLYEAPAECEDRSPENLNWDHDDEEDEGEEDEEEDEEDDNAIVYNVKKGISVEGSGFHPSPNRNNHMTSKVTGSASYRVKPSLERPSLLKVKAFDKVDNGIKEESMSIYLKDKVFRPNEVREAYRVHVDGCVTAQLLISECLILLIGSAKGGVWLSRGLCEDCLVEINLSSMWKESLKSPLTSEGESESSVIGFVYSTYAENNELTPVVYCLFSCGSIAVVCLQNGVLLAYSSAEAPVNQAVASIWKKRVIPKDIQVTDHLNREKNAKTENTKSYGETIDKSNEDEYGGNVLRKTAVATVITDILYNIIKRPEYRSIYSERESNDEKRPGFLFYSIVTKDNNSAASAGCLTARTDSSEGPIKCRQGSFSNLDVRTSNTDKDTKESIISPKYLIVVAGGELMTYDISKFSKLIQATKPRRSYTITSNTPSVSTDLQPSEAIFSARQSAVETVQVLSSSSFIIGQHLLYVEGASRAWTDPLSCFSLINQSGVMSTISLKSRTKVCETSLLEQFSDPPLLRSDRTPSGHKSSLIIKRGVQLSNGNCYLLEQNGLLLNTTLSKKSTHILTAPLPTRVLTNINLPLSSSLLYTGQEHDSKVDNCRGILKKQQSSMFGGRAGVHSGPADLIKLFSKTRDSSYVRPMNEIIDKLVDPSTDSEEKDIILDGFDKSEEGASKIRKSFSASEKTSEKNSPVKIPVPNKLSAFLNKDKNSTQNDPPAPVRRKTLHGGELSTAQSAMSENLRSLEERGDALRMVSKQGEELENGAHVFRDLVKKQRKELEKKNRWGGLL